MVLARTGDGISEDRGWNWRGPGMVLARTGDGISEMTIIYGKLSKNAKKMQKNAKTIAYMKKYAYLCSGFGNSPGHNTKILKRYGKERVVQGAH